MQLIGVQAPDAAGPHVVPVHTFGDTQLVMSPDPVHDVLHCPVVVLQVYTDPHEPAVQLPPAGGTAGPQVVPVHTFGNTQLVVSPDPVHDVLHCPVVVLQVYTDPHDPAVHLLEGGGPQVLPVHTFGNTQLVVSPDPVHDVLHCPVVVLQVYTDPHDPAVHLLEGGGPGATHCPLVHNAFATTQSLGDPHVVRHAVLSLLQM